MPSLVKIRRQSSNGCVIRSAVVPRLFIFGTFLSCRVLLFFLWHPYRTACVSNSDFAGISSQVTTFTSDRFQVSSPAYSNYYERGNNCEEYFWLGVDCVWSMDCVCTARQALATTRVEWERQRALNARLRVEKRNSVALSSCGRYDIRAVISSPVVISFL